MTFTDDDLKRLKLVAENPMYWVAQDPYQMPREELSGLLARLEAAEEDAKMASLLIHFSHFEKDEEQHRLLSKAYADAREAWGKASGKE